MNKRAIILFFPSPFKDINDSGYPWPLLHLERMIRHLDIEVILIDERLNKDYADIINKTKGRLLFAGVSTIIGQQIIGGIKFSKTVKSITNVPILWGGWFPTVFPEMVLHDDYADYICIGQGEIPFKIFTERILNNEDVSDIAGIGYKKNEKILINPNHDLVNPNSFPSIDRTLIDANKLIDLNGKIDQRYRMFNYFVSYGCPYNCGFCNVSLIFGNKWFAKKISEIIEDLKYYVNQASISQINFYDNNFFVNKKFVMELCYELIREGFQFKWSAHGQVNYFLKNFSDDDIQLLYKAGFRRLIIGADSGHQKTLDFVNKKIQVENNLSILKVCKKHNILTRFHSMICFPLDPDEDFKQTMNMIGKAIFIDPAIEIDIAFFKPIPKTPLFETCLEKGYKPPTSTSELICSFSQKSYAPWYKRDYHKELEKYLNFYFLFANFNYYRTFPIKLRPFVFLFSLFIYPIIYLRFKLRWMKFPIEAMLFKKTNPNRKEIIYFDTFSVNKTRILKNNA